MSAVPEEKPAVAPATEAPAASEKAIEASAPTPAEPVENKEVPVTEEKKTETPAEQGEAPVSSEQTAPDASKDKVEEKIAAPAPAPADAAAPPAATGDVVPAPSTSGELVWPETAADHPLTQFYDSFEKIVKEASHDEVWGIPLTKEKPFHTKLILQKFLRANQNDLTKAKEQLRDTLKWREEFDPAKAAQASYEKSRFDGLGWIIELEGVPESPNKKDIATFNIYGAVKDNQKTFGDVDGFLKWRVGLMERSVQKLDLASATKPIPNYNEGPDPYQGYQIHDYLQVSFLRRDPVVKAATQKTIETLGRYYPETLSRKFFVNVPVFMGWVYSAVTLFVAKETKKKFTVLSYGNQLAAELGTGTPNEYGGSAGELKDIGEGVKLEG